MSGIEKEKAMHRQNDLLRPIVMGVWLAFLTLPAAAAGEGVSGVWNGTMEVGPGHPSQRVLFTLREAGGAVSGTVSIPGDSLEFAVERGEYDEGFLFLSGTGPVATADGSKHELRFVFFGVVDGDEETWEGEWRLEIPETGVSANTNQPFTASKGAAKPGGVKRPPVEPASMAGLWKGTVTDPENEISPATYEIYRKGQSWAGRIIPAEDGGRMPAVDFAPIPAVGGKFTLAGSATVPVDEEGGTADLSLVMSGYVNGDAWRGDFVAYMNVDGTQNQIIAHTFRLRRETAAHPRTENPQQSSAASTPQPAAAQPSATEQPAPKTAPAGASASSVPTASATPVSASSGSSGSIRLAKTTFGSDDEIEVTVTGVTAQMELDQAFVAVYKAGARHQDRLGFVRLWEGENIAAFDKLTLDPGEYEIRVYTKEKGFTGTDIAGSAPFVQADPPPITISLAKSEYPAGGKIAVAVRGISLHLRKKGDVYAVLHEADSPNDQRVDRASLKRTDNMVLFNVPKKNGQYEIRVHLPGGVVLPFDPFTVAGNK